LLDAFYAPAATKGASVGRDIVIITGIIVLVSSSWGWACIPFAARHRVRALPAFVAGAALWPLGLALIAAVDRTSRHLAARSEQSAAGVVPSGDGLVGATHHG
jgi:hypothetical protein